MISIDAVTLCILSYLLTIYLLLACFVLFKATISLFTILSDVSTANVAILLWLSHKSNVAPVWIIGLFTIHVSTSSYSFRFPSFSSLFYPSPQASFLKRRCCSCFTKEKCFWRETKAMQPLAFLKNSKTHDCNN